MRSIPLFLWPGSIRMHEQNGDWHTGGVEKRLPEHFGYSPSPFGDLADWRKEEVSAKARCDFKGIKMKGIPLPRTDGTFPFLHWDNRQNRLCIKRQVFPKSGHFGCVRPQPSAMDDDLGPLEKYYAGMLQEDREKMFPCRVPLPPIKDQKSDAYQTSRGSRPFEHKMEDGSSEWGAGPSRRHFPDSEWRELPQNVREAIHKHKRDPEKVEAILRSIGWTQDRAQQAAGTRRSSSRPRARSPSRSRAQSSHRRQRSPLRRLRGGELPVSWPTEGKERGSSATGRGYEDDRSIKRQGGRQSHSPGSWKYYTPTSQSDPGRRRRY